VPVGRDCSILDSLQLKKKISATDDMILVHASKTGDSAAFEELVRRYNSILFRIAQRVTRNHEDAQDAVQDAFLNAFQKLSTFQENSAFSTWLIRITINESLMKLRKQRAKRELSTDCDFREEKNFLPLEIPDGAASPEDRLLASEIREILVKTLQTVRPGMRMVFVLHYMEGFSLDQTAGALDLSQSAVKARSRRARLKLREGLRAYFRRERNVQTLSP
jgi:RNA polymerase sigma-70 factor (ECF subfamily)